MTAVAASKGGERPEIVRKPASRNMQAARQLFEP
jgi:hypothetical protein